MDVLVVERDAHTAHALLEELERGLTALSVLETVRSGRAAAELLRSRSFGLVVADLATLEDLAPAGDEAIARLVRLAEEALVVTLSDGGSVSAVLEAMRAGAHEHVAKPLGEARLADRIRALVERHGKAPALEPLAQPPAEANRNPAPAAADGPDVLPMWQQEQRIIEDAIARFGGNVALAAAALELSPSTIYRKRQAWAEMDGKRGAA